MSKDYKDYPIQVLTGLQAIRKRPSMYVGELNNPKTLTKLIIDAMSTGLENIKDGKASRIDVIVSGNEVIVSDNGPGISVENRIGLTVLERMLTQLHAGSDRFQLMMLNALCEFFYVGNRVDHKAYFVNYKRGEVTTPLYYESKAEYNGTTFNFKFDEEIFGGLKIDKKDLAAEIEKVRSTTTGTINLIFE